MQSPVDPVLLHVKTKRTPSKKEKEKGKGHCQGQGLDTKIRFLFDLAIVLNAIYQHRHNWKLHSEGEFSIIPVVFVWFAIAVVYTLLQL